MVRYDFEKDVQIVMESVVQRLRREDPTVTIRKALYEIYEDLDVALVGAPKEHSRQRIRVMQTAIDRLGLQERREQKLKDYLEQD